MNGACDHFLARAALAQNQHWMHTVGRFGDDAIKPFHFRRTADDPSISLLRFHFLAQNAVLGFQFQVASHALQQQLEFINAERLGHIVVGSVFHRLYRGLHRSITGDHHDHGLRTPFFDFPESIEPSSSGET